MPSLSQHVEAVLSREAALLHDAYSLVVEDAARERDYEATNMEPNIQHQ